MKGISLYTVARCKHSTGAETHNKLHASRDGEQTLCGKDITNGWWYIINNTYDGEVTCKECISNSKERI